MCPACLRGCMSAGPDEVRLPGSIQSIGLDVLTALRSVSGYGPWLIIIIYILPLHGRRRAIDSVGRR